MNIKKVGLLIVFFISSLFIWAQKISEKPNIIFLLADDHSYLSAGFNGNKVIKTPHLDKLANKGIVFDNYYNTTAICMASRSQIMTGMYEYKTGCNFLHGSLTKEQFQKSYPVLLREAGYEVSFAGKFGFATTEGISENIMHNKYEQMPVDAFDEWRGGKQQTSYNTKSNKYMSEYADKYPHSSRSYGAWASDYIKSKKDSKKPFCMSISFKAPHKPNTPDPFFDGIYDGITIPLPKNYGRENATHLPIQAKSGRQYLKSFKNFGYEDNYQKSVKNYYQLIYGVDYAVGMLIDALKEAGLDKNTIIIYTGDNGYHLGAHGFGGKVLPYEEGSKSPFIFYDPRSKNMEKQIRINSMVGNVDVAPTVLELAGVKIPKNMDGKSILKLTNNPSTKLRPYLPVYNMWGTLATQALCIETEDFKYIYWNYEGEGMKAAEELYDKNNDPIEMKNLVSNKKYKKELEKLRTFYDQEIKILNKKGINYNGYEGYKILFDRHLDWSVRKDYILQRTEN